MTIAITPPIRNQHERRGEVELADHLVVGGGQDADDGATQRGRRRPGSRGPTRVIAVVTCCLRSGGACPVLAAAAGTAAHHGRVTSSQGGRWPGTTGDPIRRRCPRPDFAASFASSTAACSATARPLVRVRQGPPGSWACPIPSRGRAVRGLRSMPVRALARTSVIGGSLRVGSRASRDVSGHGVATTARGLSRAGFQPAPRRRRPVMAGTGEVRLPAVARDRQHEPPPTHGGSARSTPTRRQLELAIVRTGSRSGYVARASPSSFAPRTAVCRV